MDYAIYKTIDGKHPRIIHRFTQEASNRQAKKAAKEKMKELLARVVKVYSGVAVWPTGEEFSYDHPVNTEKSERIRFYIAKL